MTRSSRRPRTSLLESLQSLLERTYRMDTGVDEIGRYIIGDEGYRRFYGSAESRPGGSRPGEPGPNAKHHAGHAGGGARVLVHDAPGALAAHIYYPDRLIRELEANPPAQGLGDPNVDSFATFIEELDHFLLIAERARLGRPVSLLELEMHADVSKYLVCALFLSRGRGARAGKGVSGEERLWLRWHLFEKLRFAEPDPLVQARYRDAARYAHRFLERLEAEPRAGVRLTQLRAFHDSSHQQKLSSLA